MLVYYYTNEKFGREDLQLERIKVSDATDLNDPFDHMPMDMSDAAFRAAVRQSLPQLAQHQGFICLSRIYTSVLMWSHYADKHKGVCLGFEVPDGALTEIKYVPKRIYGHVAANNTPTEAEQEYFLRIVSTKHVGWSYEQEMRFFIPRTKQIRDGAFWFYRFAHDMRLRRVVIGANCNLTPHDVQTALPPQPDDVEVFKARAAFKDFKIVRNKKPSKAEWSQPIVTIRRRAD